MRFVTSSPSRSPSLFAIAIVSPFVAGFLAMARIYPAILASVKIFLFVVASCRLLI